MFNYVIYFLECAYLDRLNIRSACVCKRILPNPASNCANFRCTRRVEIASVAITPVHCVSLKAVLPDAFQKLSVVNVGMDVCKSSIQAGAARSIGLAGVPKREKPPMAILVILPWDFQ
jgi:hypothetical protein